MRPSSVGGGVTPYPRVSDFRVSPPPRRGMRSLRRVMSAKLARPITHTHSHPAVFLLRAGNTDAARVARATFAVSGLLLARASSHLKPGSARFEAEICSECGRDLEGRQRVTCGSQSCREARLKRTNPEVHAKREAGKVERRRQARRRVNEKPAPSPAT
jgi:hypothetical protein